MLSGVTVLNIREYLSAKDDIECGERALQELFQSFLVIRIGMLKVF